MEVVRFQHNEIDLRELGCSKCKTGCTLRCGNCKKAAYCSMECQKEDYQRHKSDCYPFTRQPAPSKVTFKYNITLKGQVDNDQDPKSVSQMRVDVCYATRDIKQGEILLEESPIFIGPTTRFVTNLGEFLWTLCLGCNIPLPIDQLLRCVTCRWFICGRRCPMLRWHTDGECDVFAENRIHPVFPENSTHCIMSEFQYSLVRYVRALQMQCRKPEKWEKLLNLKEYLDPIVYQYIPSDENLEMEQAVEFIRKNCNMVEFDEELIKDIIRIDSVFGCYPGKKQVTTLITTTSQQLTIHPSCYANVKSADVFKDINGYNKPAYSSHLFALTDIKIGEEITIQASDIYSLCQNDITGPRRAKLYSFTGIWCKCKRCADPKELGTGLSAIKCQKCPQGYCFPVDPLEASGNLSQAGHKEWKCEKCRNTIGGEVASLYYKEPYDECLDILKKAHGTPLDAPENAQIDLQVESNFLRVLNRFLKKWEKFLYPNHFVYYSIRCRLAVGLAWYLRHRQGGMTMNERQERFRILYRLQGLSKQCFEITEILYPGLTIQRARDMMLYTLAKWLTVLETLYTSGGELCKVVKLAASCKLLLHQLNNFLKTLRDLNPCYQVDIYQEWIDQVVQTVHAALARSPNDPITEKIAPILFGSQRTS